MRRVVKYTAIDPYYSDVIQEYCGFTEEEIDCIQDETEKFMGREHPSGLMSIYKTEIIEES